ncbi:MAG: NRPS condensation-like uncharacterized protein [Oleiphilaceae bacterium]|jgi:NRPS condensation-like uncharacterized protein
MTYQRPLSTIERYYVSCDSIKEGKHYTPCIIQMVIEGDASIDVEALRRATTKASYANPGSRVKLKGHLGFSRWVDSEHSTPVRVIENDWNGLSNAEAEFLQDPLPVRKGPTSEVLIIINKVLNKSFVIIRSHHGAMDGRGTLHFSNDVFRCLRGELPVGENNNITDMELAKSINHNAQPSFLAPDVSAPTGQPINISDDEKRQTSRWVRRSLHGKHKGVLAKVALEIAHYTRLKGEQNVRFQIPVDMRFHKAGLHSTANLTGGIVVTVDIDTNSEQWNQNIKSQLADKKETEIPRFFRFFPFHFLNWIPRKIIHNSNNRLVKKRRIQGQFRTTGILSNLGLLKLEQFSGKGFNAQKCYFVPPEFDTTALFVTLAGHPEGVEILIRAPTELDGGRIEKLLDFIIDNIEHKESFEEQAVSA